MQRFYGPGVRDNHASRSTGSHLSASRGGAEGLCKYADQLTIMADLTIIVNTSDTRCGQEEAGEENENKNILGRRFA